MQSDFVPSPNAADARPRLHLSRLAPVLGGLLALGLYAATLPPGLTWAHDGADGGDFLAAALTAGVPHPTGYPTYQLLLRAVIAAIGGDAARAGAWFSAMSAALAVAFLVDLARRAVSRGDRTHRGAASWAGLAVGLAWAASAGLWSQAVIVEVYALNGLFCVVLLWLAWRWSEALRAGAQTWAWSAAAGLAFGLGLGNHLTVALMLPGLAVWIWSTTRGRRSETARRRDLGPALLGLLAGLLVYVYLPLAASGRPSINWGDPSSLAGFLWVVTGRPYAGLAFGLPLAELPARLLGWAAWTVRQLQPWGLVLALAGLWRLERASRAWWLATLLIWFSFTVYAIGYNTTDSLTYLIPSYAVLALWAAEALYAVFVWAEGRRAIQATLVVAALAALPLASVASGWQEQNLGAEREAEEFLSSALGEAAPGAVILASGDARTFALWYGVYGLGRRTDVAVLNVNLYAFEWYRRTLAERHPYLLPSEGEAPPIESLVADLVTRRPVYAVDDLALALPGLDAEQRGVLTRLSSP